ncbi:hypothetical protein X750_28505 [Mesorhizobium sp. LNJC394B00]|nr:hypothetical protein X750_28505 [Mesorhizobium sp. LNJC394B00]
MLIHPTIDMLRELGLHGMATAFQELDAQSEARGLEHGEWLAMLLEREATMRRQKLAARKAVEHKTIIPVTNREGGMAVAFPLPVTWYWATAQVAPARRESSQGAIYLGSAWP